MLKKDSYEDVYKKSLFFFLKSEEKLKESSLLLWSYIVPELFNFFLDYNWVYYATMM